MSKNQPGSIGLLSWVLLLVLALIWGSSFILYKKGLLVYQPGHVGALRIVSAALVMLPTAIRNFKKVTKKQRLLLLFTGLLGSFIPAFLFAIAQTQITSSVSGILNAMTPFFVLIFGALLFGQSIKRQDVFGLIMGFSGTILLITAGSAGNFSAINGYALFVILATVCYGININFIKFKLKGLNSLAITSISLCLTAPAALAYLLLVPGFFAQVQQAEGALFSLMAVVLLGVFGTAVALIFFNRLVQLTSPVFTSYVTYIIPIVAVVWGVADGEVMQVMHYIGMLLIIIGLYISSQRKK